MGTICCKRVQTSLNKQSPSAVPALLPTSQPGPIPARQQLAGSWGGHVVDASPYTTPAQRAAPTEVALAPFQACLYKLHPCCFDCQLTRPPSNQQGSGAISNPAPPCSILAPAAASCREASTTLKHVYASQKHHQTPWFASPNCRLRQHHARLASNLCFSHFCSEQTALRSSTDRCHSQVWPAPPHSVSF